jgi:uncharacterized membrane protein (UPF0127 family)
LLRHRQLADQEGLLLVPGGTVHTFGMRFEIDVVFLNRQMRVIGLAEHVAPWRVVSAPKETARVAELAAGRIATIKLTPGTYLIVDCAPDERPTVRMPRPHRVPCERSPIQLSLRIPLDRRCTGPIQAECSDARVVRSPPPCPPVLDARAVTTPSAES